MLNKRFTSILFLTLSFLFPCLAAGDGGGGRFLRFDEPCVDLGEVDASLEEVAVEFAFTNIHSAPVTVVDVYAQCSCTRPSFSPMVIKPGGGATIKVKLLLKDLTGPQKRHLTVISTDGEKRRFSTISIICTVKR